MQSLLLLECKRAQITRRDRHESAVQRPRGVACWGGREGGRAPPPKKPTFSISCGLQTSLGYQTLGMFYPCTPLVRTVRTYGKLCAVFEKNGFKAHRPIRLQHSLFDRYLTVNTFRRHNECIDAQASYHFLHCSSTIWCFNFYFRHLRVSDKSCYSLCSFAPIV